MRSLKTLSTLIAAGLLLSACSDVGKNPPQELVKTYKVSVQNLTLAQPMSPLVVAYHTKDTSLYSIGASASISLEKLAEGGDNSALLQLLSEDNNVEEAVGGSGLVVPGEQSIVTVEGVDAACISIASMLVNTNDAFVAASCVDVSTLKKGEQLTQALSSYDAGTEKNDEEAMHIPGPAGGGEGFNTRRDDRDFVASHGGVVTADDGLATSALNQNHKWNNPTALLTIERIK